METGFIHGIWTLWHTVSPLICMLVIGIGLNVGAKMIRQRAEVNGWDWPVQVTLYSLLGLMIGGVMIGIAIPRLLS